MILKIYIYIYFLKKNLKTTKGSFLISYTWWMWKLKFKSSIVSTVTSGFERNSSTLNMVQGKSTNLIAVKLFNVLDWNLQIWIYYIKRSFIAGLVTKTGALSARLCFACTSKGQWISECLFDFFKFSKKPMKNLTNFCSRI